MTPDFDRLARKIVDDWETDIIAQPVDLTEAIVAALRTIWNQAMEEAAASLRPSALYGDKFAKALRAKKITS